MYWVTHRYPNGNGSFSFSWTAPPTSVDEVYFYATGNAANGNSSSSGDHIYSTSTTVNRDLLSSVAIIPEHDRRKISLVNPVEGRLRLRNAANNRFTIYNIKGKQLLSFRTTRSYEEIDVSGISKGSYLLMSTDADFAEKFILR